MGLSAVAKVAKKRKIDGVRLESRCGIIITAKRRAATKAANRTATKGLPQTRAIDAARRVATVFEI